MRLGLKRLSKLVEGRHACDHRGEQPGTVKLSELPDDAQFSGKRLSSHPRAEPEAREGSVRRHQDAGFSSLSSFSP